MKEKKKRMSKNRKRLIARWKRRPDYNFSIKHTTMNLVTLCAEHITHVPASISIDSMDDYAAYLLSQKFTDEIWNSHLLEIHREFDEARGLAHYTAYLRVAVPET